MKLTRTARSLAAASTATLVLTMAPAAHAEEGYRYWGYSQLVDGAWVASTKGAASITPEDGSVEGWRYQTSAADVRAPRDVVTFDEVCGSTTAVDGKKRVAVVEDFGRDADAAEDAGNAPAPTAECAVVDEKATGAEVLAAVAEVTSSDAGMVCAIDAYPAHCEDSAVKEVSQEAAAKDDTIDIQAAGADTGDQAEDTSGDMTRWLWLAGAALALTALLGWLLGRGRKPAVTVERTVEAPHAGATRVVEHDGAGDTDGDIDIARR